MEMNWGSHVMFFPLIDDVFRPQSGQGRREKRLIFPKFSKENLKVFTAYIYVQYIRLNLMKCFRQCRRNTVAMIIVRM